MRMASRYGHAWVSQYGPLPDGIVAAEWRDTLKGISLEQLRVGFAEDAIRTSDWPPTSTRFRAMCLGIPTLAAVRHEVSKVLCVQTAFDGRRADLKVSGFTRLAWSFLDVVTFRMAEVKRADRMLRDAYELASKHVMEGGELPMEPVAYIAEPDKAPVTPEQERRNHEAGEQAINKIAEMLRTEPVKPYTEVEDDHDAA